MMDAKEFDGLRKINDVTGESILKLSLIRHFNANYKDRQEAAWR